MRGETHLTQIRRSEMKLWIPGKSIRFDGDAKPVRVKVMIVVLVVEQRYRVIARRGDDKAGMADRLYDG